LTADLDTANENSYWLAKRRGRAMPSMAAYGRYYCKSILRALSRNIDSLRLEVAQLRFVAGLDPDSIVAQNMSPDDFCNMGQWGRLLSMEPIEPALESQ
jgi:hypothetical protein